MAPLRAIFFGREVIIIKDRQCENDEPKSPQQTRNHHAEGCPSSRDHLIPADSVEASKGAPPLFNPFFMNPEQAAADLAITEKYKQEFWGGPRIIKPSSG